MRRKARWFDLGVRKTLDPSPRRINAVVPAQHRPKEECIFHFVHFETTPGRRGQARIHPKITQITLSKSALRSTS